MFKAMLEVAEQGGNDILYVDTVREFAGASLSEFKANLTAIEKAGMTVQSLSEKNYNYDNLQTVIQVLEDLTPGYRKNYQQGLAAIPNELGISIQDIVGQTILSESDVYQAIAEYKREQERRRERKQEDEDKDRAHRRMAVRPSYCFGAYQPDILPALPGIGFHQFFELGRAQVADLP